ncbi:putative UDP-glucose flavonoid 3-O-glucosyltransferase 3 [Lycium barbarum]|uniref:putative UDP-glucose flavonoid 3-O-glucosyltransferase 3 n=1 Tax=Lycium barbarum TaxID=112863 RepID=UPI00293E6C40|nr:putative UDP-glucose flavonoid 3-O-glucosyltransferase 3 [Lycium barbarum]
MSKLELVFVPAPAVSHLVSTCKFAEKLLDRDERLCITILIIRPPPPWDVGIDAYIKRSSSAPKGFLCFLFYLSIWHDQVGREFDRSDADLKIAAYAHPVPSKALPTFAFSKEGYDSFREHGVRFKETTGILINTVAEFESHVVNSLASDPELPPVYTVGFLNDLEGQKGKGNSKTEDEEIMKWLDQQPPSSVLFLCFGSAGIFEPPQLIDMAIALERSGVRFLWSIYNAIITQCSITTQ